MLGTGRRRSTGPSVDVRRSALFVVWHDGEALERFLADDPLGFAAAAETWWCGMRLRRGRGSWGAWRPDAATSVVVADEPTTGPVVVLTRAAVRPRAVPAFLRASRRGRHAAQRASGCRAVVGIGDVPILRLGTLSIWDDAAAAAAFSTSPDHAGSARSARRDHWFVEELFGWFEPIASGGSWDRRNPLAEAAGDQGP